MKYNKDKQKNLKKFATGGKTPAQIMEEARRNQAIERQAQARDAVSTSGIAAYQSAPVTIQTPRQEVVLKEYAASKPVSFSQAFGEANKAGLKEFTWNGKRYTTDVAGTPQTTPSDNVQDLVTETPTGTSVILNPEWGTYGQFSRTAPGGTSTPIATPTFIPTPPVTNTPPVRITKGPPAGSTPEERRARRQEIWGPLINTLRTNRARNRNREASRAADIQYVGTRSIMQQGGKIEDNPLHLRNGLEKFFRIEPRYTSVNPASSTPTESVTDYMDNTWRGPQRVSKIRKPRGENTSGYLTSTRVISNPWTDKADTTYIAPTGARFGSSRIIEAPYLQSYPDKFGKYFKHQQGGKVESANDEMYVDFAVRYLSALGVGETEMVDEEGGLREEYAEAVTVALQEIDSPEFWEHYHSNPDEAVGAYVESKQSPEQVEMAKKGAKLKMLKKAKGGKVKKCKCGCGMTMKKEKGGKLTEVCSCGCKN